MVKSPFSRFEGKCFRVLHHGLSHVAGSHDLWCSIGVAGEAVLRRKFVPTFPAPLLWIWWVLLTRISVLLLVTRLNKQLKCSPATLAEYISEDISEWEGLIQQGSMSQLIVLSQTHMSSFLDHQIPQGDFQMGWRYGGAGICMLFCPHHLFSPLRGFRYTAWINLLRHLEEGGFFPSLNLGSKKESQRNVTWLMIRQLVVVPLQNLRARLAQIYCF